MTRPKALSSKALGWAVAALMADEVTKWIARTTLDLCSGASASCDQLRLAPAVRLIRISNAGSAFGFSQGSAAWPLVAATAFLLIPLIAGEVAASPYRHVVVGLILSGALGNMIDRLLVGGATDFIGLGHLVVNVGDLELIVGAALAMMVIVRVQVGAVQATCALETSEGRAAPRAVQGHGVKRSMMRRGLLPSGVSLPAAAISCTGDFNINASPPLGPIDGSVVLGLTRRPTTSSNRQRRRPVRGEVGSLETLLLPGSGYAAREEGLR